MSIATDNRAVFHRFYAALGTNDEATIDRAIEEAIDPDVTLHTPLPTDATGAEALRQGLASLRRAFPDLRLDVQDVLAERDKLVARTAVSGTHRGEHFGVAPTGRPFAIEEIMVFRFRDGRVVEIHGVVDVFGQLQQLGALPV